MERAKERLGKISRTVDDLEARKATISQKVTLLNTLLAVLLFSTALYLFLILSKLLYVRFNHIINPQEF